MGDAAGAKVRDQALPFVMDNSMNLAKWVINISAISVIVVISSILITGEKDEFNRKINKSLFREEITMPVSYTHLVKHYQQEDLR